MFAQVLDCQFWELFPFGQQHVDNTLTGSATSSGTERKQPLHGRTTVRPYNLWIISSASM